jgi:hypothetical protein
MTPLVPRSRLARVSGRGWFVSTIEEVAAAACGASLWTDNADSIRSLVDGAVALLVDSWPDHLLTRDYACRVFDAARARGWTGAGPSPSPGVWPMPARSVEEIEAIAGSLDYEYGSIWFLLTGMGRLRPLRPAAGAPQRGRRERAGTHP